MRIAVTTAIALALLAAVRAAAAPRGDGTSSLERQRPKGTKITTRPSRFGTVLVNRVRQQIYVFDKEEGRKSECFGGCAKAWPPVFTRAKPRARGATRAGLLGTIKRGERRQVTYKGHPLYYYAHEGPGQILCQNVSGFGGLWQVVAPSGEPVP